MRKLLLFILLIASPPMIGQPEDHIGASFGYGYLWPHRSSMHHLVEQHTKAVELTWERQTDGYHDWEQFYDKPAWGVLLFAGDLGNRDALGMTFSVYPYVKLPLAQNEHTRLHLRIGTGFGVGTKSFDANDNHKNIALGSRFNGTMGLQLGIERRWQQFKLGVGIGLTHFSNAAYQMPNLGYNIPTINLTIAHIKERIIFDPNEIPVHDVSDVSKWSMYLVGGYGLREVYPPEGHKFHVGTISALVHRNISRKVSVEGGLDLFYNSAIKHWLMEDGIYGSPSDVFQMGIHLGFEQRFSRFGLNLQMGGYVVAKYREDGNFYHRVNFRYHINEAWLVHWGIKTHLARADHFEVGVGYTLK